MTPHGQSLKSDKFLVVAHRITDEVAKAKKVIEASHPADRTVHTPEPELVAAGAGR